MDASRSSCRCVRIGFTAPGTYGPIGGLAAEHDLGMLVRRAALGADQKILTVVLEDVRRLDPDRLLREVDAAVHDHRARPDHLFRGDVELLHPDRAVAFVQRLADRRTVVHDVRLAVVVEEQRRIIAIFPVDLGKPDRIRPRTGGVLRRDDEVSGVGDAS